MKFWKILGLILLIVVGALLFGCTVPQKNGSGSMANDNNTPVEVSKVVKVGDHVAVHYTGRLTDGTIFDSSVGKDALEFDVGAGQMIKGFDNGVIGMKVGEKKTIQIASQEAYGELDPQKIVLVDANQFSDFSSIKTGMFIMASNGMRGKVVEKTDTNAKIDFNHELAGKTLIFDVTLVSIS